MLDLSDQRGHKPAGARPEYQPARFHARRRPMHEAPEGAGAIAKVFKRMRSWRMRARSTSAVIQAEPLANRSVFRQQFAAFEDRRVTSQAKSIVDSPDPAAK
jgi:hypothetical protein